MLFESCENTDIGVGVPLAFGTRPVIAEERFDPISEVGRLLPVNVTVMPDPSWNVGDVVQDRETMKN